MSGHRRVCVSKQNKPRHKAEYLSALNNDIPHRFADMGTRWRLVIFAARKVTREYRTCDDGGNHPRGQQREQPEEPEMQRVRGQRRERATRRRQRGAEADREATLY